jgi:hypothetical protein
MRRAQHGGTIQGETQVTDLYSLEVASAGYCQRPYKATSCAVGQAVFRITVPGTRWRWALSSNITLCTRGNTRDGRREMPADRI